MPRRLPAVCLLIAVALGPGCGADDHLPGEDAGLDAAVDAGNAADAAAAADAAVDAAADAGPEIDPTDAIFALDVLHQIELEIDPRDFDSLDWDHETRVPANLTYDGIRLEEIGIREKCGYGSCSTMADKPAFSLKMDTFVAGQELAGLERLILNNSVQDTSYSNELLGQAPER